MVLSLIDKAATKTSGLVLVIKKFAPVMLLCSTNTQSFVHNKKNPIPQILKVESRNLQKVLKYLSGIVTSTFKIGTSGRFESSSIPGHAVVFPTTLLLHLNDVKKC